MWMWAIPVKKKNYANLTPSMMTILGSRDVLSTLFYVCFFFHVSPIHWHATHKIRVVPMRCYFWHGKILNSHLKICLLTLERERKGERGWGDKHSPIASCLCLWEDHTHTLLSALTGTLTHNPVVWGGHSSELSHRASVEVLHSRPFVRFVDWMCEVLLRCFKAAIYWFVNRIFSLVNEI